MQAEQVIQGRRMGPEELGLVRHLLAIESGWHRSRLSRELCERWAWRNDAGRLKDMACRTLLLKLERRGLIRLPARQSRSPNALRNRRALDLPCDRTPIEGPLSEVRPVRIEALGQGHADLRRFRFLLQTHHYLGLRNPVGENIKYLVRDRHGCPLACLLFGAAAWKAKARDETIGWSAAQRERALSRVANNARFLILPWVRVPHLAAQKAMQEDRGKSNAQALFQIERIPCDNHIGGTLDEVPPEELYPLYDEIFESLREQQVLSTFQTLGGTTPIALDGTWYFSSENIHCAKCSSIQHQSGPITYYHSAITPVIVAPGQKHAIALRPEFIAPQDGHTKQDCEIVAAKRWLDKEADRYLGALNGNVTYLGDDIYAHQPFCRRVLLQRSHFIFTCKPDSHPHLTEWVRLLDSGGELRTVSMRVKDAKGHREEHTYRYANGVPLAEGEGALKVNWCEVTITGKHRKSPYHSAWVTDWKITEENVAGIAATGRCRWKIENENNNTLKTKGYHLEHNFGHGKKHLSSLLAAMNMLALLTHTFLSYCDEAYRLIRAKLPTREIFFEHIRALMHYIDFESWAAMMDFMMRGLEIGPYAPQDA